MSLKINSREKGPGYFGIALEGRLDGNTSPRLEALLIQMFQGPVRSLQFDMQGGLRQQRRDPGGPGGHEKDQDRRRYLRNFQPRPSVRKVFDIARALPRESVFKSIAEADAYFDSMQKEERSQ